MGHPSLSCVTFVAWTCVLLYAVTSLPLDDYVNKPDDHYNYTLLKQIHEENYALHILNMTSQKWMDETYSDHPIWWHYVVIIVPSQIKVKDTALLFVDSDRNTDKVPDQSDIWVDLFVTLAVSTQTVMAVIKQIPNQPIVFKSDPDRHRKSEDSVIAWSWREFILNPDKPEALVHMAMTKAVVRAMDTIDSYSNKTRQQPITKFFLSGASKRGWTTWLTSAVDKRIIGMAPIVFDLLNTGKALGHHYQSLGGWTFAFKPYIEAGVVDDLSRKGFNMSLDIIDPLVYRDRYKVPTYIVKAAGDEFFLLDETVLFYNQLTQPHYLRVVPNCEHTMLGQWTNMILGLRSFYLNLIHEVTYPKVNWTMTSSNTSGTTHVTMDMEPLTVTVYQAHTLLDGRRDFRLLKKDPKSDGKMLHPVFWFKEEATRLTSRQYKVTIKTPAKGWRAFFIEVTFKGAEGSVIALSTEVNVIPNTLPFPSCFPKCSGNMV